jgi:Bacterial PH domain
VAEEGPLPGVSSAHIFRPAGREGAIIAASAGGLAVFLGIALVLRWAFGGITLGAFLSGFVGLTLIAAGAQFLYWAYGLYNLRYSIDDASLTISWGFTQVRVPVQEIRRIVLGQRYGEPRLQGLSWPGCHIGRARVARIGEVLFYSAHQSSKDLVYLSTSELTLGLSPADPRGFARAIQNAQDTGAYFETVATASYRTVPEVAILTDNIALVLGAIALSAFLLAAGYIYYRYQFLPLTLTLDFPPLAGIERIGRRSELLQLPLTALVWLLLGYGIAVWSRPRFRTVCYAVLAGTAFVECLYVVAAFAAAH